MKENEECARKYLLEKELNEIRGRTESLQKQNLELTRVIEESKNVEIQNRQMYFSKTFL